MPYNKTGRSSFSSRLKTVGREAYEEDLVGGFAPATTMTELPYSCAAEIRRNYRLNDAGKPTYRPLLPLHLATKPDSSKVCQRLLELSCNRSLW